MSILQNIKDIGSGTLGGLPGVITGGLTGIIGDMFGDENADEAFARQMRAYYQQRKDNRWSFKNRYSWTMDDMARAGLNPILAASGGFNVSTGGPTASLPNVNMAPMPNVPSISASAKEYAQVEQVKTEVGRIKAETKRIIKDTQLKSKQIIQAVVNTSKMRAEKKLIEEKERETVKRIEMMHKEMQLLVSKTHLTETERVKVERQIQQIEYQFNQLKDISDVYGGFAGKWLAFIRELMRAIGIPVAGALMRK
jgi:hypothetical protein